jgi:dual specificity tyrosine-phosphorylation-regulated kinase 2/3/4
MLKVSNAPRPKIPKPPGNFSNFSKILSQSSLPKPNSNENSLSSHRHSRSYGRITPNQKNSLKQTCSPPIPSKQLEALHSKLSDYEHRELSTFPEVYYLGTCRAVVENTWDDREGYYKVHKNDHINYRYQIIEEIGRGTFGNVVKCRDVKTDTLVAIKILKKSSRIARIAKVEIEIFDKIQKNQENESCIVEKISDFWFRGHLCIEFELLTVNLYDLLKNNRFQGAQKGFIRRVAMQVLVALKLSHSLGIVHCDLKPENVVLRRENKSGIKLIDFGSAWTAGAKEFYIQSRFYRAPEVILQADWNEKIDIWSLGCILAELVNGWPLFSGNTETDVLFHIIFVLGPPEKSIFQSGRSKISEKYDEIIADYEKSQDKANQSIKNSLPGADPQLVNFIESCLQWEKNSRPSAEEALAHPWLRGNS